VLPPEPLVCVVVHPLEESVFGPCPSCQDEGSDTWSWSATPQDAQRTRTRCATESHTAAALAASCPYQDGVAEGSSTSTCAYGGWERRGAHFKWTWLEVLIMGNHIRISQGMQGLRRCRARLPRERHARYWRRRRDAIAEALRMMVLMQRHRLVLLQTGFIITRWLWALDCRACLVIPTHRWLVLRGL
jgi:hypothetical protein